MGRFWDAVDELCAKVEAQTDPEAVRRLMLLFR
jgi:hypothetical protein